MLQNIHVKNMALIDEADVDFGGHLNILPSVQPSAVRSPEM